MVKLPKLLTSLLLCLMAYACPVAVAYAAPSLQLDRPTVSVQQNATFQEKINIAVESNQVQSSDAIIKYVGADLEVTSVTNGGFFPEFSYANDASGTLEIHGYTTTGAVITGNGVLATITFKAKKNSGSSAITYACTGSTNSTNILTTGGQNILTCGQTNQASISFTSAGATNTVTPTATTAPGVTNSPTPTPVPGDNVIPVCASLYSDVSMAVGTPQQVTFTCSGVDSNGYINAAEFIFGDGTSQIVEKNVGSPGSIATTHTYSTIGSLGASCRVRDNTGTYSSVPDNCKKIITIKQATKTTSTSTGTGSSLATPTPTPAVVSLVSETPEPTAEPTIEPTVSPEELTDTVPGSGPNRLWWIIGGLIAIILAILLLKRRGPPPMPPMPPSQPMPPMNPPVDMNQPVQHQV
jgi:hypothetical protein